VQESSVAAAPPAYQRPAVEQAAPPAYQRPPAEPAAPPALASYEGPRSGTLECTGGSIPQNAEFVFRNLPPLKLKLDYDTNNWDARLGPGDKPGTQRLILRNKSNGPQKRCTVHWSIIP
jgi:hypothetical protein